MGKMFSEQLLKSRFIEEKSRDPRGKRSHFLRMQLLINFRYFNAHDNFNFSFPVWETRSQNCACFSWPDDHTVLEAGIRHLVVSWRRLQDCHRLLQPWVPGNTPRHYKGVLLLSCRWVFVASLFSPACRNWTTAVPLFADDPTEPDLKLMPPSFLVSLEYNTKDPNIIAGGCYNGQVRNLLSMLVIVLSAVNIGDYHMDVVMDTYSSL